jgi:hypothetical protein
MTLERSTSHGCCRPVGAAPSRGLGDLVAGIRAPRSVSSSAEDSTATWERKLSNSVSVSVDLGKSISTCTQSPQLRCSPSLSMPNSDPDQGAI